MQMTPKPNFTPRAQQAINEAKKVAKKYNSELVTIEHLFFGMVKLSAGILSEILFLLNIDQFELKNNIEKFYQERISGLDLKTSEDKIVESFENYLRTKFLDFENNNQIDKKLKSYKKDLNEKFKAITLFNFQLF